MRMPTSMLAGKDKKAEAQEPDFSLDLLDESQMLRLKRAFSIFDKDDSGSISSDEMLQVCAAPRRVGRGGEGGDEALPTCNRLTRTAAVRAPAAGIPVTRQ